jgi:hypothetical protein
LSLPVYSDPALCEEVEALAREIAGTEASAEIQELARGSAGRFAPRAECASSILIPSIEQS